MEEGGWLSIVEIFIQIYEMMVDYKCSKIKKIYYLNYMINI